MRRIQFPKTYSTGEKDWVTHRLQNRQPAPTDRSERQGLRTCRLKPLPKGINIWSPSNDQHCNFSGFHQTLSSAPNVKHIYLPHQFESMHRSLNPMVPNLPRIVSEPKRKCPKAQTRQQNTSYITAADWMPHKFWWVRTFSNSVSYVVYVVQFILVMQWQLSMVSSDHLLLDTDLRISSNILNCNICNPDNPRYVFMSDSQRYVPLIINYV